MNTMLTIAGSDSIGGAGIQADIKTALANGVYSMSVITSVTAQNTVGVQGIHDIPCDFVRLQLDSVFTDIFPDAVKVGMVSNSDIIKTIAERLKFYQAKNIVCDTVMVSTSGNRLISESAIDTLKNDLITLATVITPNVPEAEVLSNMDIKSKDDMVISAKRISKYYRGNILIKGGHLVSCADDLLYTSNGDIIWFESVKIDNSNTHGTGCTLSSAIASYLSRGKSIQDSIQSAKEYITRAISFNLNVGHGNGSLWHGV
ncbi:MAG: bifunctional hydroxymethylpyrimidine kinase/phosphomethylpyrimidine kinase [Ruminococcus sp.]|nr:bifunctional hydroxymethylpyrimidine kinase/phosphomethylpyrimidine kinase [Ruminococcus sp.]